MGYFISSIVILPFSINKIRKNAASIRKNFNYILVMGIATAATEILYALAVKYSLISYIISLKRASIIFSVVIGLFIFKERNFKSAIVGSIIMFAGAVLITMS